MWFVTAEQRVKSLEAELERAKEDLIIDNTLYNDVIADLNQEQKRRIYLMLHDELYGED